MAIFLNSLPYNLIKKKQSVLRLFPVKVFLGSNSHSSLIKSKLSFQYKIIPMHKLSTLWEGWSIYVMSWMNEGQGNAARHTESFIHNENGHVRCERNKAMNGNSSRISFWFQLYSIILLYSLINETNIINLV